MTFYISKIHSLMGRRVVDRSQYLWIVLSVAFASFISGLNIYIVNISLPALSRYFGVSTSIVSRIALVYLLAGTSTLLFFGKLGDRFGLKKILVLGYFFFTGGSLLCAISWNIDILILFRFMQGLGGAMLTAASFAIIPKFLPKEITGWAFGIVATGTALGIMIGAPLGGIIIDFLSWRWLFLIKVPVGIVAIFIALKVLPGEKITNSSTKENKQGFNILSTLLSFLGLFLFIYALNMGQEYGWASYHIISIFVLSLILLLLFTIAEKVSKVSLLDYQLFKNVYFFYAILSAFCYRVFLGGNGFILPFYLETVKGMGPVKIGLLFTLYGLAFIVVGYTAGRFSDKVSPSLPCAMSMFSASVCSLVFAYTLQFPGTGFVYVLLIWLGVSSGLFIIPNYNQVMQLAHPGKQGIASGIFQTINIVGTVIGVTLFETIFSEVIPHEFTSLTQYITSKGLSIHDLFPGFCYVYIFGGVVCLMGLLCYMMILITQKRYKT